MTNNVLHMINKTGYVETLINATQRTPFFQKGHLRYWPVKFF
jgi:hypothetical protein